MSETHFGLLDRVIAGDCLEVMKDIPDHFIDMVLCDLPYGTTINPWDTIVDFGKLWKHYRRIIKPREVIALTAVDHSRFQPYGKVATSSALKRMKVPTT